MDEALDGLTWAISKNAESFRTVPGLSVRVGFVAGQEPAPPLKVYLKILDDERVELLWVEVDEEGAFREWF